MGSSLALLVKLEIRASSFALSFALGALGDGESLRATLSTGDVVVTLAVGAEGT